MLHVMQFSMARLVTHSVAIYYSLTMKIKFFLILSLHCHVGIFPSRVMWRLDHHNVILSDHSGFPTMLVRC